MGRQLVEEVLGLFHCYLGGLFLGVAEDPR